MPTSTYSQAPLSPTSPGGFSPIGQDGHGGGGMPLNTLDEPVWETVKRDLKRIGANLVLVVFPFKNWDQQSAALRNWDLWGPMVRLCIPLAKRYMSSANTREQWVSMLGDIGAQSRVDLLMRLHNIISGCQHCGIASSETIICAGIHADAGHHAVYRRAARSTVYGLFGML